MITRTEKFIKGHWGRILLYTVMVAILYTGFGCMSYKQRAMEVSEFKTNKRIQAAIEGYNFYVHDGDATYKMQEVQLVNGKDLSGTLVPTSYEEPQKEWSRQERRDYWKAHRYDIHIFTHASLNATASVAMVANSLAGERVTLTDDMIKEMRVMVLDPKGEGRGYVDAVIAVALIIGALVALTIILLDDNDNDNTRSGGSDGSDGGSDSGGGSDSD
jgi:hypothetical protein